MSWKLHFSGKRLHCVEQNSRKEIPLEIRFYFLSKIISPKQSFSKASNFLSLILVSFLHISTR